MKKRLDQILVEKGLVRSREEAKRLILAGNVLVEGRVLDKAGMTVPENADIKIKEIFPYVSRGALKIQKAIQEFKINLRGKIVCDIGASTGGFTDFSLQNGAKKVYAIDVGYGQLDQKLRNDPRVVVMERTNIRNVESLPELIDIFTIDVSFISLKQVLPIVKKIIESQNHKAEVVALIKPQFEVGKKIADKCKGVIKDENIQNEVVEDIQKFATDLGFETKGVTESPILGAKGNKEFLLYLISN